MVVLIAEFAAILKFINDLMAFKDLLRIFELFEEHWSKVAFILYLFSSIPAKSKKFKY
jgi:hypothetical protein